MKTCLFIPCYNVEQTVGDVIRGIPSAVLSSLGSVLLIDNDSRDGTIAAAAKAARESAEPSKFRLRKNDRNFSLGGSTVVAFDWALARGYDFLICLHSDGQADPRDLEPILSRCQPGVDFVLGNRMAAESQVASYSRLRLAGNRVLGAWQRLITRSDAQDLGAFIAFNLKTVARLPYRQVPRDMGYQPLLILFAFRLLPVIRHVEVPISWGAVTRSNINPWAYGLRHAARLALLQWKPDRLLLRGDPELASREVELGAEPHPSS